MVVHIPAALRAFCIFGHVVEATPSRCINCRVGIYSESARSSHRRLNKQRHIQALLSNSLILLASAAAVNGLLIKSMSGSSRPW